jgi:hypothetical protein
MAANWEFVKNDFTTAQLNRVEFRNNAFWILGDSSTLLKYDDHNVLSKIDLGLSLQYKLFLRRLLPILRIGGNFAALTPFQSKECSMPSFAENF